jgi:hypothetical protein
MKVRALLLVAACLMFGRAGAQTTRIDTVAVSILDRMSAIIGELNSCSVVVRSNYDVSSRELGLVKHSDEEHVYIGGADKMLVRSEGDKGSRSLLYDGKTLSYYSMDKNHYSQVDVPSSLIEMIDHMNKNYGIVFPAADFLYPGFVDDIIHNADNLELLGMTKVGDKECFHIAGTAKDKTFQFWIANDAFHLPVKLVIVNTDKPMNPQYEATYCDWQLNPVLPAGIFEFHAPPSAKKIKLVPLTAKN